MKIRKSDILKYVLSAGVSVLLLYFSFRGVEWKGFMSALHSCRWGYIVVSMLAGVLAFWLRGLRWRYLLLPVDGSITRLTAFNAVNIGYIANFVFPRIGEFVRCGVITKNSVSEGGVKKAPYDKVLGTVVLERAWDMLTMLLFIAAMLVFGQKRFGSFFMESIWDPAAGRFGSAWVPVLSVAAACCAAVVAIWIFRDRSKFLGRMAGLLKGIVQGVGSCLRMDRKWLFFFYTLLIWGLYWMMGAATMRALPVLDALDMTDALFLMLAGSLGWLVPVPGGFGSFHFIVSLALSVIYGIPMEQGVVFATLSHEAQAITMILCGGCSYVCETFRKKK